MSTWIIAGAPGRRARCTRANTNVGETTGPSTSITRAIPLASTVFPAPSGPDSTTTSPARNLAPSWAPNAMVSSAVANSAVPEPRSAILADPVAHPPREGDQLGRGGPLDKTNQAVVDGLGSLELDQMPGTTDDHELGLRQCCGHALRVLHRRKQVAVAAGDQGGHSRQCGQPVGLVVDLERVQELHQRGDRRVVHHLLGERHNAWADLLVAI